MVFNIKFEEFAHHTLYLMDAGIAELNNFAAFDANDVVVLFVSIGFLKLGHVFSELVFRNQIT